MQSNVHLQVIENKTNPRPTHCQTWRIYSNFWVLVRTYFLKPVPRSLRRLDLSHPPGFPDKNVIRKKSSQFFGYFAKKRKLDGFHFYGEAAERH
jgi:hypothetical protein